MTEIVCDLCGDPTDGYCCSRCAENVVAALGDVVGLAGEVETTVARLARYATRGGRQLLPPEEQVVSAEVNRRNPLQAFGWQASVERPKRGALRPTPLPVDLHAAAAAAGAFNAVTTWARHCSEQRGHEVPVRSGQHPAAAGAAFLLGQVEWLRHQPEGEQAFPELSAAGATIRRVVDAPPERQFVGRCPCGEYLYAYKDATTVTCTGCRESWDVEASRQSLMEALQDRLVTAAEAATFLAFFGLTGDRSRSRKTIVMWTQRGLVESHGELDGNPLYRFGDVLERATRLAQKSVSA